jgi:hypothetical protein
LLDLFSCLFMISALSSSIHLSPIQDYFAILDRHISFVSMHTLQTVSVV